MFSNVFCYILTIVKHFGLNQNVGSSHWDQLPHCEYSPRKVTKVTEHNISTVHLKKKEYITNLICQITSNLAG